MGIARRCALALALVAVLAQTACFVNDELNEGQAELKRRSPGGAQPAQAATAGKPASSQTPAEQQIANWWHSVRSFSPEEKSSEVVRCRIGGAPSYVSRSDCLARGGEIAD